jgi:hypothetical protein
MSIELDEFLHEHRRIRHTRASLAALEAIRSRELRLDKRTVDYMMRLCSDNCADVLVVLAHDNLADRIIDKMLASNKLGVNALVHVVFGIEWIHMIDAIKAFGEPEDFICCLELLESLPGCRDTYA